MAINVSAIQFLFLVRSISFEKSPVKTELLTKYRMRSQLQELLVGITIALE